MPALKPKPDRSPDLGGLTIWSRDGVAVLMPTLDPRWIGTAVETAYLMRVEANLTGQCPSCLAISDVQPTAPRRATGTLEHEADCPAGDDGLGSRVTAVDAASFGG
jgi:hypothetical protein